MTEDWPMGIYRATSWTNSTTTKISTEKKEKQTQLKYKNN
jgi:hypothetical protein